MLEKLIKLDKDNIVDNIKMCEDIIDNIDSVEHTISKAKNRWEVELMACEQERAKIQKTCLHLITQFFPDASGNNDSFTQCDICHKIMSRKQICLFPELRQ